MNKIYAGVVVGIVGAQVFAQNPGGCSMGVVGAQNDNNHLNASELYSLKIVYR